jgi:type IV pilus assembly protein PilY1
MNMRLWATSAILALACALSLPARADDTDIYTANGDANGGTALVMFSIDFRADLNSTDSSGCTVFPTYHSAESVYNDLRTQATAQCVTGWKLFDTIRFGLWAVMIKYQDSGLKIGLMMNHNNDNSCAGPSATGCSNGGEILMGFQLVSDADGYAARTKFLNKLAYLKSKKLQSNMADHPYQGSELFFEFFRYLTGQHIYNEHNGWTDFEQGSSKDTSTDTNPCSVKGSYGNKCDYDTNNENYGLNGAWDAAIEDSASPTHRFITPLDPNEACAKIFTINFMFQVSQSEADSITAESAATSAEGVGSSVTTGGQNNYFPNILSILYQSDLANGSTFNSSLNVTGQQNVTSYFFVPSTKINTTTTGYASSGGTTTPYALDTGDASGLTASLDKVFSDILSVSTTFVAAAIPANVFNRSQSLDRLYIALFEAATNSAGDTIVPFWNGDLKKLKLVSGVVKDSAGSNAVNAVDGRVSNAAVTYWTNAATLDATCFGTGTGCVTTDPTAYVASDSTSTSDGRQVNRGGAGQKIPGYHTGQSNDPTTTSSPEWTNAVSGSRKVYYDPASISSSGSALLALNVNNSTSGTSEVDLCNATVLGLTGPSDTNCEKLLKFMRGIDPTVAYSAGSHPASRKWLLGDPLHSRPIGVNYGACPSSVCGATYTSTNPAIFVAVSGNDGALHYIKDTDNTGTQIGQELWSFIPKAAMGLNPQGQYLQKVLMANTAGTPHTYGLDGAPVAYIKDVNGNGTVDSGDKVFLIIGQRRGGYSYYGLDVTDPTTPKIKWRIDNTGDFSELGLSFAIPKIGFLNNNGTKRTVLFFGGGYDTNKDTHALGTNDSKGRAIYAIAADTGTLIWKAVYDATATGVGSSSGTAAKATYGRSDLTNSIPSDVTILDTNNDGYIDRLVVGDTAGNLWRGDFAGSDATKWTLTLVAKLGRLGVSGTATKADDRRLFYPPEVVQTTTAKTGGTAYDAYLIGSGDREDPLDKGADTTNYFFNVRDSRTGIFSTDGTVSTTTTAADMQCSGHACTYADMTDLTDNCLQGEGTDTASQATAQTACSEVITNGWKVQLDHTPAAEKSLASPLAVNGVVFFTTYVPPGSPDGSSCGPAEGSGFQWAVNILDATAAYNYNTADGGSVGSPNTKADRTTTFATNFGGIPAQDVLVNNTPGVTAPGCDCLFQPGLTCQCVNATRSGRTFWQRLEQIPQ